MTGFLFAVLVLVAAGSAVPVLPRGSWIMATPPSTKTPYTKPTDIPDDMPETCSARPPKNGYLMIVSPITCTRFIVCHGLLETEMDCPAGLWFNYEEQYCDWPHLSGCDESKRPGLPTTAFDPVTSTPTPNPNPNPNDPVTSTPSPNPNPNDPVTSTPTPTPNEVPKLPTSTVGYLTVTRIK